MPFDNTLTLALDRSSVRTRDVDGRLHVATSPITKANVCGYRGSEIPGSEALGLDPDKVYQLLRDPEELRLAVSTFDGLPILSRHVPLTAADHRRDVVVGSTGSAAMFRDPYLTNSLVIWDAAAIRAIETGEARELSAGYRYVADMTPGRFRGERYQGVMRSIRGNHVALVSAGRAGDDVVVMDSKSPPNALWRAKMRKRYGLARDDRLGLGDNGTNGRRGRDEDDERNGDLSGWEREAVELHELLAELLTPEDLREVEGRLHRLLLNGDGEANAMGGSEVGMPVGRPSGRDAEFKPMAPAMGGGTDRRRMAGDAALRLRRLEAEAKSYYARFPEARRARVVG